MGAALARTTRRALTDDEAAYVLRVARLLGARYELRATASGEAVLLAGRFDGWEGWLLLVEVSEYMRCAKRLTRNGSSSMTVWDCATWFRTRARNWVARVHGTG